MSASQKAAPVQPRRRDAARTRQVLLEAASRRFARDGYSATTVRDIADDAGVNVALISRYFTNKEGLFEVCLTSAVTALRTESDGVPLSGVAAAMAHRIAGSTGRDQLDEALLLLLRTSGDERIDDIRRVVLRSISEQLAVAAGGSPGEPGDSSLLHAQIVFATALGLTVLRSSLSIEPLATATEQQLVEPLTRLVDALLPPAR